MFQPGRIRAIIEEAELLGETKVELGSNHDAKKFRQSVYNWYHHNRGSGHNNLTVSITDRIVTLRRRVEI